MFSCCWGAGLTLTQGELHQIQRMRPPSMLRGAVCRWGRGLSTSYLLTDLLQGHVGCAVLPCAILVQHVAWHPRASAF